MPLYNNVIERVTEDKEEDTRPRLLSRPFDAASEGIGNAWNALPEPVREGATNTANFIRNVFIDDPGSEWNQAILKKVLTNVEGEEVGLQKFNALNESIARGDHDPIGQVFGAAIEGVSQVPTTVGLPPLDTRATRTGLALYTLGKIPMVPRTSKLYQSRIPVNKRIVNVNAQAIDDIFTMPPADFQAITRLAKQSGINSMTLARRFNEQKGILKTYLQSKGRYGPLEDTKDLKGMATTGGDQPNEFQQLVLKLEEGDSFPKLYNFPSNQPTPFISQELNEQLGPDGNRLEGLTYQELQSIGPAVKTYMTKRAYKDAATVEGYARMTTEVEKAFSDLLGDDFDRDLVRQYMLAVSKHEEALTELQKIANDKTGKLWDKQHANALRNLEHSGRMLGNKGLFSAFNYPDVLDQTPLGKPKVNIEREGNRPDRFARGADFQKTLMRVLGKPLSLHESILYFYDQDMFYFYKELSPLQRQQLVDSSRTRSGGRIKSELTVAENINQALESMKFGQETMSGKLGRPLTDEERLKALVDLATSELLKKRKYKRTDFKTSPRQGNVFYDIDTGKATDYSPDPGIGSSWDIEDPDPDNKYSK